MTKPLDPDTLAEGERRLDAAAMPDASREEVKAWRTWAARYDYILLAVARDHARLTAAVKEVARVHVPMPGKDPSLCGWCGVLWPCFSRRTADDALSAEAGDTDG
jgi:hypothetical protein